MYRLSLSIRWLFLSIHMKYGSLSSLHLQTFITADYLRIKTLYCRSRLKIQHWSEPKQDHTSYHDKMIRLTTTRRIIFRRNFIGYFLTFLYLYFPSPPMSSWTSRRIYLHTLLQYGTSFQPTENQIVCRKWRSDASFLSTLENGISGDFFIYIFFSRINFIAL